MHSSTQNTSNPSNITESEQSDSLEISPNTSIKADNQESTQLVVRQPMVWKISTPNSSRDNTQQPIAQLFQAALKMNVLNPLIQTAQLTHQLSVSALAIQSFLLSQLAAIKTTQQQLPQQQQQQLPQQHSQTSSPSISPISPKTIELPNNNIFNLLTLQPQTIKETVIKKSNKSKKIKKINTCGHPEKEHYAKNLCYNCYHKHGRNKKPWNCNHEKLYAQGLCQNCYIAQYNQKRNQQKLSNKEEEINVNIDKQINEFEVKVEESSLFSN